MYNRVTDSSNAKELPIQQDAWDLFHFENLQILRLHLAPGESMENHVNDWRIIFFLLDGRGALNIEGADYLLGKQQSIAVEAGKERFWRNTGDRPLQILVIKSLEEGP